MKLSTRARYGLRICFLMALSREKPLSLTSLVKQTDLSEKYLEQLLILLRKAGIVESVRGAQGGYYLTRDPEKISINELLIALNDGFDIADCASGECPDEYCPNKLIFRRLKEGIDGLLTATTLSDMIKDYKCVR